MTTRQDQAKALAEATLKLHDAVRKLQAEASQCGFLDSSSWLDDAGADLDMAWQRLSDCR